MEAAENSSEAFFPSTSSGLLPSACYVPRARERPTGENSDGRRVRPCLRPNRAPAQPPPPRLGVYGALAWPAAAYRCLVLPAAGPTTLRTQVRRLTTCTYVRTLLCGRAIVWYSHCCPTASTRMQIDRDRPLYVLVDPRFGLRDQCDRSG